MAKVIKRGGGAQKSAKKPANKAPQKRSGKVIDREVYQAQQEAQKIISDGETEKQHREESGILEAQKSYDQAYAKTSQDSEQALACTLIQVFQQRSLLVDTAMEDVKTLAMEVIQKVLGTQVTLPSTEKESIIADIKSKLLKNRVLQIGITPALNSRLETAEEFDSFFTQTDDLQLIIDKSLLEGHAWIQFGTLKLHGQAQALMGSVAQNYDHSFPNLEPQQKTEVLKSPSPISVTHTREEHTMAISLDELKERAQASKRRKNKDK